MKTLPKNIARKIAKMFLYGAIFIAASCATAHAQILVSYSAAGVPGGPPYSGTGPAVVSDPNNATTALDLSLGSGFDFSNLTQYGGGYAVGVTPANGYSYAPDLAGSITKNTYITFTVAPTSGNALNITSLDFSTENFYLQSNSGESRYADLESSVTGFTSTASLGTMTLNGSNTYTAGTNIDLSSNAAFANITGPVEFRLYFTDPTNPAGYESVGLGSGSFTVNGTSISLVPEPSTWAMMLGGLGALLFVQARRRRT